MNIDKMECWEKDTKKSVEMYNKWFLEYAPKVYTTVREQNMESIKNEFKILGDFKEICPNHLKKQPSIITTLRMCTAPPLARDRLIGFTGVPSSFIDNMEKNRFPQRIDEDILDKYLICICKLINNMLDKDIFKWIKENRVYDKEEYNCALQVISDRICAALSNPIIRNAQEERQLKIIEKYLTKKGYKLINTQIKDFKTMKKGTFSFRTNVQVTKSEKSVNMPIDVVIMRKEAEENEYPILIECKSAGDFTNTNKRRKEEAQKMRQLKDTYGEEIRLILFLCGYFDSGYLQYEASSGLDWIWEHRLDDMEGLKL